LPITLYEATKVVQPLLLSGKEYVCVLRLHGDVEDGELRRVLEEFTGVIYQKPPLRSSVKRRLRKRRIYYIELLERVERDVLLKIGCEAGTYIRKLCFDIGEALGCGAHMVELRRTRSGPLREEESVTLHELFHLKSEWEETGDLEVLKKVVLPMEKALDYTPKIYIRDSAVDAICHGAELAAPGVLYVETGIRKGDQVAVMTLKGEAVALAKALATTEEILEMNKGFVAKTQRVLMPRGVYPKSWQKKK